VTAISELELRMNKYKHKKVYCCHLWKRTTCRSLQYTSSVLSCFHCPIMAVSGEFCVPVCDLLYWLSYHICCIHLSCLGLKWRLIACFSWPVMF